MRLQHDISPEFDYRLALTCWANGSFEVIPSFTSAEQPHLTACKVQAADCVSEPSECKQTSLVIAGGNVHQTDVA